MRTPPARRYTAKEVEKLKSRMEDIHQREMREAITEWYARGKAEGKRIAINDMRNTLGLEPISESE